MEPEKQAHAFTHLIDLAAERFGGKVLWCTDDFFAGKENLIKPGKPVFIPDKYTDRGKWMDGWESRRKRTEGHDEAVIQLGAAGVIKGFDVDTSHFLGNHPPHCSIDACYATDGNWEKAEWTEILPKTGLNPGSQHFFEAVNVKGLATHVKLHIYPDGGVARLRVYGEPRRDWSRVKPDELLDLAAAENGGLAIQCKRHVLQPHEQPDHAWPRREHGRRLGDPSQTARRATAIG
jgi:allantoicase